MSLLLFVVKNIDEFKFNFEVHSINTRHWSDLFPPATKLSKYHKAVYYSGIKIFNRLPQNIKHLSRNVKKFKVALKKFLLLGSFYTLNEYFDASLLICYTAEIFNLSKPRWTLLQVAAACLYLRLYLNFVTAVYGHFILLIAIIYIYIYIYIYTGCNRRNGPNFGRVFLMLNYTEKNQNTYIQS